MQREQIEAALADADGAYGRLRLVMDAWCALWFWPLTDTLTTIDVDGAPQRIQPPSLEQWLDALRETPRRSRRAAQGRAPGRSASATTWPGPTWTATNHWN